MLKTVDVLEMLVPVGVLDFVVLAKVPEKLAMVVDTIVLGLVVFGALLDCKGNVDAIKLVVVGLYMLELDTVKLYIDELEVAKLVALELKVVELVV